MFQAFSSLGNQWRYIRDLGDAPNPVLNHPLLTRIAAAHKRSVAQVVLRWQQQLGVAIIPASRSPTHQKELISMAAPDFMLSSEEMAQIESLDGLRIEALQVHVQQRGRALRHNNKPCNSHRVCLGQSWQRGSALLTCKCNNIRTCS